LPSSLQHLESLPCVIGRTILNDDDLDGLTDQSLRKAKHRIVNQGTRIVCRNDDAQYGLMVRQVHSGSLGWFGKGHWMRGREDRQRLRASFSGGQQYYRAFQPDAIVVPSNGSAT
jgi:hypothetical protein